MHGFRLDLSNSYGADGFAWSDAYELIGQLQGITFALLSAAAAAVRAVMEQLLLSEVEVRNTRDKKAIDVAFSTERVLLYGSQICANVFLSALLRAPLDHFAF